MFAFEPVAKCAQEWAPYLRTALNSFDHLAQGDDATLQVTPEDFIVDRAHVEGVPGYSSTEAVHDCGTEFSLHNPGKAVRCESG
jgi:hypothetical protein